MDRPITLARKDFLSPSIEDRMSVIPGASATLRRKRNVVLYTDKELVKEDKIIGF